jgi:hypothetical protein
MRDLVPLEERTDADDKKRLAVTAMVGAMRHEHERRRRRRLAWAAFAAAAGVTLALGSPWTMERARRSASPTAFDGAQAPGGELHVATGVVKVVHGTTTSSASPGHAARVGVGDEIQAANDANAVLALPRGVEVQVAAATDVSVAVASADEQRLTLDLGRTDVSVPRPGGPHVFSIKTPDSEVVVHGTIFSVAVERNPLNGERFTSVSVTRGSVLVIHGGERRLLEAHESWSSRTVVAMGAAPSAATSPPNIVRLPEVRAVRTPRVGSGLTEQNRLFQASLDARDAHDDARAIRSLDELLARFPNSPLADQARIARDRAAERLGARQTGL